MPATISIHSLRRRLRLLLLAGVLVACGQAAPLPGAPRLLPISGPVPGVPGRLLYDRVSEWWTLDPGTQTTHTLATFPDRTYPTSPAASPDGTLVAFGLYSSGTGVTDPAYGTDLYLMNADGTNQRRVLTHTQPGETLAEPAWSPDGQAIYFTRRSSGGTPQIERVARDGGDSTLVVENAQSPTVSFDGHQLAFLVTDPQTGRTELRSANADGTNSRPILAADAFQLLGAPRFAPDRNELAFAAVKAIPASPPTTRQNGPFDPLGWLQPRVAQAHGIPWEIWVVKPDGSALRQLTDLQEDTPTPTWSPDGQWIGFRGELGLYIVDAAGKQTRRVSEEVVTGMTWLSP